MFKNGEKVLDTIRRNKRKILTRLTGASSEGIDSSDWDKAYLKVTYPLGRLYTNEGWFTNQAELLDAYRLFTEEDLVRSFT